MTDKRGSTLFTPSQVRCICICLLFAAYFGLAMFRLGWADVGSDEGRFGVSAVNILTDVRQLAIVSEDPLGEAGTKPYFYPLAIAGSMTALGKSEFSLRLVNVVVLALAGLALYGAICGALGSKGLGIFTLAFFLLNPWTITYAHNAMPEPMVVFSGCLALLAVERWHRTFRMRWPVLCGLALGIGYLSKLWLIAPFAAACAGVFVGIVFRRRNARAWTGSVLAGLIFGCVAASHLLLALWLTPALFSHWRNIYFVFSLKSRVAGAGYDPAMWFRPWWFYAGAAFKASCFALPLLFIGIREILIARPKVVGYIALALLSPVLIFSAVAVKQTSYVYGALPAMAFIVALGCIAIWRGGKSQALIWATLLSAGVAGLFFAAHLFGAKDLLAIEGLYCVYLGCAAVTQRGERSRRISLAVVSVATLCAMLAADVVAVDGTLRHRTNYREIAAFLRPLTAGTRPQDRVFVAPEFPAMQFYTFRSGEYWRTFYWRKSPDSLARDLEASTPKFFIVDPSEALYGSQLEPDMVRLLREHARDVTTEIERSSGDELHVTVFRTLDPQGSHE